MGNHGKVRVSQNPEPLRGTTFNLKITYEGGKTMLFWRENEMENRDKIHIAKERKVIDIKEISEEIRKEIEYRELEIQGSITEDEFQDILCTKAEAWTVRRKKDGMFLKEISTQWDRKTIDAEWTSNLRDAFIFNKEHNAMVVSISLSNNKRECEYIPLIYQIDPLYVCESSTITTE
ncbi:TPA: hypothetical protein J1731_004043 [Escherichia coli]|uniref:hypothetical protein n=1 Tax=Escherichia TaxID=561 RepID=UPI0002BAB17E|nr:MULTISPECIES: hypothetical protein [Escherichia]EFU2737346.1 hypothetical protein [Escherichia coli]EGB1675356.1 hypothetical protein [Escherichia coli]EKQ3878528.1 hypothetical protein [Escherichia coli]EKR5133623.1 hypothetical protein [Escherichia coli]EKS5485080.1 hypothetical protein [Escherichia coli]